MATTTEQAVGKALVAALMRRNKNYADKFKDANRLSKLIAVLTLPFGIQYMAYITTLFGCKIYWKKGSQHDVENFEWWTTVVRAHEGQHMWDWPWLKWVYGLPHLLALPLLVLFVIFGGAHAGIIIFGLVSTFASAYIWKDERWLFLSYLACTSVALLGISTFYVKWPTAYLFAAYLCMSPLLNWLGAAAGRAIGEIRAYQLTIAMDLWRDGSFEPRTLNRVQEQLVGPSYYFMLPWKKFVERRVYEKWLAYIAEGGILKRPWARFVHATLKENGLLASTRKSNGPT